MSQIGPGDDRTENCWATHERLQHRDEVSPDTGEEPITLTDPLIAIYMDDIAAVRWMDSVGMTLWCALDSTPTPLTPSVISHTGDSRIEVTPIAAAGYGKRRARTARILHSATSVAARLPEIVWVEPGFWRNMRVHCCIAETLRVAAITVSMVFCDMEEKFAGNRFFPGFSGSAIAISS